jgi:hypothetical protein
MSTWGFVELDMKAHEMRDQSLFYPMLTTNDVKTHFGMQEMKSNRKSPRTYHSEIKQLNAYNDSGLQYFMYVCSYNSSFIAY